jgi:murein DD-endopeptidase MepM/ murein hydrolase activator NlpD
MSWLLGLTLAVAGACPGMSAPVRGDVVRPFAPDGAYAGHWGVDFAVSQSTPVRASSPGSVTFAGSVAGMRTVTIDHGDELKTSYSYLSGVAVVAGSVVATGALLGWSGVDHGIEALHFSLRLDDEYRDPLPWLACSMSPGDGLALLPVLEVRRPPVSPLHAGGMGGVDLAAYPPAGATRPPRRNVRSTTSGTPVRR